ncbi:MAG: hypothetical protein ACLVDP_01030 [Flavonifractor plautii]
MAAEKTGFIGAIWSVWGQRHWPLGQSMCSALCGRTAGKQASAPPAKTPLILERTGLDGFFDAVADGSQITKSKPDPEVFRWRRGNYAFP